MKRFLFSVDLEEFDAADAQRPFRRTPLPVLAEAYLELLRRHRMKATFFVVGQVASAFPDLIRAIVAEGHELGCHTHSHRPLNEHTRESLRDDLRCNLDELQNCAPAPIQGFRAPVLSLTPHTRWAYEVLAELGFTYSSSVLPSANPLHGWPGFGEEPVQIQGVRELPVTLANVGFLRLPIGAGTYFRCLPFETVRRQFHALAGRGRPVVGYFHPYDCDTAQQWVMNRGVRSNPLFNALLFLKRSQTLRRLDLLVQDGFQISRYDEYLFPETIQAPHARIP